MGWQDFNYNGYLQTLGATQGQIAGFGELNDETKQFLYANAVRSLYQENLQTAKNDPFLLTPKDKSDFALKQTLHFAPDARPMFGLPEARSQESALDPGEFASFVANHNIKTSNLDFYLDEFTDTRINDETDWRYPSLSGLSKRQFKEVFKEEHNIDPDNTTVDDVINGRFGKGYGVSEEEFRERESAWERSMHDARRLFGETLNFTGDMLGALDMPQAKETFRRWGEYQGRIAMEKIIAGGYQRKYGESFAEAIEKHGAFSGVLGKAYELMAENWATSGTSLLAMAGSVALAPFTGGTSSAAGLSQLALWGTRILPVVAGLGSSLEFGAARDELVRKGVYDENDPWNAFFAGGTAAALDFVGALSVGGKIGLQHLKAATRATAAERVAARAAIPRAREIESFMDRLTGKSFGRRLGFASGMEGATEFAQEYPAMIAVALKHEKGAGAYSASEWTYGPFEAGVVGALMGGATHIGGEVGTKVTSRIAQGIRGSQSPAPTESQPSSDARVLDSNLSGVAGGVPASPSSQALINNDPLDASTIKALQGSGLEENFPLGSRREGERETGWMPMYNGGFTVAFGGLVADGGTRTEAARNLLNRINDVNDPYSPRPEIDRNDVKVTGKNSSVTYTRVVGGKSTNESITVENDPDKKKINMIIDMHNDPNDIFVVRGGLSVKADEGTREAVRKKVFLEANRFKGNKNYTFENSYDSVDIPVSLNYPKGPNQGTELGGSFREGNWDLNSPGGPRFVTTNEDMLNGGIGQRVKMALEDKGYQILNAQGKELISPQKLIAMDGKGIIYTVTLENNRAPKAGKVVSNSGVGARVKAQRLTENGLEDVTLPAWISYQELVPFHKQTGNREVKKSVVRVAGPIEGIRIGRRADGRFTLNVNDVNAFVERIGGHEDRTGTQFFTSPNVTTSSENRHIIYQDEGGRTRHLYISLAGDGQVLIHNGRRIVGNFTELSDLNALNDESLTKNYQIGGPAIVGTSGFSRVMEGNQPVVAIQLENQDNLDDQVFYVQQDKATNDATRVYYAVFRKKKDNRFGRTSNVVKVDNGYMERLLNLRRATSVQDIANAFGDQFAITYVVQTGTDNNNNPVYYKDTNAGRTQVSSNLENAREFSSTDVFLDTVPNNDGWSIVPVYRLWHREMKKPLFTYLSDQETEMIEKARNMGYALDTEDRRPFSGTIRTQPDTLGGTKAGENDRDVQEQQVSSELEQGIVEASQRASEQSDSTLMSSPSPEAAIPDAQQDAELVADTQDNRDKYNRELWQVVGGIQEQQRIYTNLQNGAGVFAEAGQNIALSEIFPSGYLSMSVEEFMNRKGPDGEPLKAQQIYAQLEEASKKFYRNAIVIYRALLPVSQRPALLGSYSSFGTQPFIIPPIAEYTVYEWKEIADEHRKSYETSVKREDAEIEKTKKRAEETWREIQKEMNDATAKATVAFENLQGVTHDFNEVLSELNASLEENENLETYQKLLASFGTERDEVQRELNDVINLLRSIRFLAVDFTRGSTGTTEIDGFNKSLEIVDQRRKGVEKRIETLSYSMRRFYQLSSEITQPIKAEIEKVLRDFYTARTEAEVRLEYLARNRDFITSRVPELWAAFTEAFDKHAKDLVSLRSGMTFIQKKIRDKTSELIAAEDAKVAGKEQRFADLIRQIGVEWGLISRNLSDSGTLNRVDDRTRAFIENEGRTVANVIVRWEANLAASGTNRFNWQAILQALRDSSARTEEYLSKAQKIRKSEATGSDYAKGGFTKLRSLYEQMRSLEDEISDIRRSEAQRREEELKALREQERKQLLRIADLQSTLAHPPWGRAGLVEKFGIDPLLIARIPDNYLQYLRDVFTVNNVSVNGAISAVREEVRLFEQRFSQMRTDFGFGARRKRDTASVHEKRKRLRSILMAIQEQMRSRVFPFHNDVLEDIPVSQDGPYNEFMPEGNLDEAIETSKRILFRNYVSLIRALQYQYGGQGALTIMGREGVGPTFVTPPSSSRTAEDWYRELVQHEKDLGDLARKVPDTSFLYTLVKDGMYVDRLMTRLASKSRFSQRGSGERVLRSKSLIEEIAEHKSISNAQIADLLSTGALNIVATQEEAQRLVQNFKVQPRYSETRGTVQGFVAPNGQIYLVEDGIAEGEIHGVLVHEIGDHARKMGFSDVRFREILEDLRGRAQVALATPSESRTPEQKAILAAYEKVSNLNYNESEDIFWEEVSAYLAEKNVNVRVGLIDRITNWFKEYLFRWGFIDASSLSYKDLVMFARGAMRSASSRDFAIYTAMGDAVESGGFLFSYAQAMGVPLATLRREYEETQNRLANSEGYLVAPNGQASNLVNNSQFGSERLWVLVRTPRFIEWFGDWLNNPSENMLLDENGEPLIVYHATTALGSNVAEVVRGARLLSYEEQVELQSEIQPVREKYREEIRALEEKTGRRISETNRRELRDKMYAELFPIAQKYGQIVGEEVEFFETFDPSRSRDLGFHVSGDISVANDILNRAERTVDRFSLYDTRSPRTELIVSQEAGGTYSTDYGTVYAGFVRSPRLYDVSDFFRMDFRQALSELRQLDLVSSDVYEELEERQIEGDIREDLWADLNFEMMKNHPDVVLRYRNTMEGERGKYSYAIFDANNFKDYDNNGGFSLTDDRIKYSFNNEEVEGTLPPASSEVTDENLLAWLNSTPKRTAYRTLQIINGEYYPPMMARNQGVFVAPIPMKKWMVSNSRPEIVTNPDLNMGYLITDEDGNVLRDKNNRPRAYVYLDKGNGAKLGGSGRGGARYNPYFHLTESPLNDQFTSASKRPNLVTVRVEYPESELTAGEYADEYAKDPVGLTNWNSGPVSSQLANLDPNLARKVILTRYARVIEEVPDSEVADEIAKILRGTGISLPRSRVTPSLAKELASRAVSITTDGGFRFSISDPASNRANEKQVRNSPGVYRNEKGELSYNMDEMVRGRETETITYAFVFNKPELRNDPSINSLAQEFSNDSTLMQTIEERIRQAQVVTGEGDNFAIFAFGAREVLRAGESHSLFNQVTEALGDIYSTAAGIGLDQLVVTNEILASVANAIGGIKNDPLGTEQPTPIEIDAGQSRFDVVFNQVLDVLEQNNEIPVQFDDEGRGVVVGSDGTQFVVSEAQGNSDVVRQAFDHFVKGTTTYNSYSGFYTERELDPLLQRGLDYGFLGEAATPERVDAFLRRALPPHIYNKITIHYSPTSEALTTLKGAFGIFFPFTPDSKPIHVRAWGGRSFAEVVATVAHEVSHLGWYMWGNSELNEAIIAIYDRYRDQIYDAIPSYFHSLGRQRNNIDTIEPHLKVYLVNEFFARANQALFEDTSTSVLRALGVSEEDYAATRKRFREEIGKGLASVRTGILSSLREMGSSVNNEILNAFSKDILNITFGVTTGRGASLLFNRPDENGNNLGTVHITVNDWGQSRKFVPETDAAKQSAEVLEVLKNWTERFGKRGGQFAKILLQNLPMHNHFKGLKLLGMEIPGLDVPSAKLGESIEGARTKLIISNSIRKLSQDAALKLRDQFDIHLHLESILRDNHYDTSLIDRRNGKTYQDIFKELGLDKNAKFMELARLGDEAIGTLQQWLLDNSIDIRTIMANTMREMERRMRLDPTISEDVINRMKTEMNQEIARINGNWEHRMYQAYTEEGERDLYTMLSYLEHDPTNSTQPSSSQRLEEAENIIAVAQAELRAGSISPKEYYALTADARRVKNLMRRLESLKSYMQLRCLRKIRNMSQSDASAFIHKNMVEEIKTIVRDSQKKRAGNREEHLGLISAMMERKLDPRFTVDRLYMDFLGQETNTLKNLLYSVDQQYRIIEKLEMNFELGQHLLDAKLGVFVGSFEASRINSKRMQWQEQGSFLRYVEVFPEFQEAIDREYNTQMDVREALWGGVLDAMKANMTVYNAKLAMNNYIGNFSLLLASGHIFRIKNIKEAGHVAWKQFADQMRLGTKELGSEAEKKLMDWLYKYHVWGGTITDLNVSLRNRGVHEKAIHFIFNALRDFDASNFSGQTKNEQMVKRWLDKARRFYAFGDEWVKPLIFLNNYEVFLAKYQRDSSLTAEEQMELAARDAAEQTLRESTTWEYTVDIARQLSRTHLRILTPDFLLHNFQMLRITAANVVRMREIWDEIVQLPSRENATEKDLAYRSRLTSDLVRRGFGASILAATWATLLGTGFGIIPWLINMLLHSFDDDKDKKDWEQREALGKSFSPSEWRGASRIANWMTGGNNLHSPLWKEDKWSMYTWNYARSNVMLTHAIPHPASEVWGPGDILRQAGRNLIDMSGGTMTQELVNNLMGRDRWGREIGIQEGLGRVASRLFVPGTLRTLAGATVGLPGTDTLYHEGRAVKAAELSGITFNKYDMRDVANKLGYFLREKNGNARNYKRRDFMEALEKGNPLTDREVFSMIRTMRENNREWMGQADYALIGLREFGLTDKDIKEYLVTSRRGGAPIMSKENADLYLRGKNVLDLGLLKSLQERRKQLIKTAQVSKMSKEELAVIIGNFDKVIRMYTQALRQ